MSNTATAPVAAEPTVVDMTTAQLSDRMSKLSERYDALKASVSEFETVKTDLAGTLAEIQKRIGAVAPAAAPAAKPKAKAKSKSSTPRQPKADGDKKYPSLKEVVLTVLGKNPDGLELKGIVHEVQEMIKRNEYASGAKSLSAVVSQAVNALKAENLINHDRDSKKYTKKAA
jgi:hypothetical protein